MLKQSTDDFALSRIPLTARRPMWEVFMIRFGGVVCLPLLMTGAVLGYGMTVRDAILATILGVVILEIVSFLVGVAGALEGMSTSFLARWTGFGQLGSSLIGFIIAISCIGWFGIQNSIFAKGLIAALGSKINFQLMALITGLGITIIVVYGYRMLSYTANIAVPAFLLALLYATYKMIGNFNMAEILSSSPPGPPLSIGVAATIVAGGFMVGAIVTPDLSRYNRNTKDVFWMTLLSLLLGEVLINFLGAAMSHAVKSSDIVTIMYDLGGWLAAILVIFSTIKINDLNLYAASLGITNFLDAAFGLKVNRGTATLVIGALGTVLSILGILDRFMSFLVLLGVAVPPVGGIMVVDYFILKRFRKELEESRLENSLPAVSERLNPVALLAWLIGFLVGYFIKSGIPSLNSLIGAGIVYWIGMKLYAAFSGRETVRFIDSKA
ncbi:cytosine permease [Thermanaeromonas toyohensis ToBE]|uniref:Cytosine permease n=1 Tax=Thermanaeromonas toyohensis ToBE TaxID=698762 RepID=A0A1W1VRD9_9FIRM|nr:cytosine permease [Thermanaeromonas toyohensis]SMB95661.1 cytosine permease [Thermanaeromonas toyohensis ToBE]